jgi:NAD(P)-dependent dehydrogenase (short-subunit alcohol dehydrogenase family)
VNSVSPGYTQTDILNFASQEMREEWLRSTPGRRFASPYEMKGVYLPLLQIYGF